MNKLLFLVLLAMGGLVWLMGSNVAEYEVVPTSEPVPGPAAGKKVEAVSQDTGEPGEPVAPRLVLPSPKQPLQVVVDDLVIVRGHVAGNLDGLLMVDCPPESSSQPMFSPLVDAGAGAAGIAAAAKWAVESAKQNDVREFGPMERVPTGYRKDVEGCDVVEGRVVVHGYGRSKDTLHVVAANTGTSFNGLPLYTLNYTVRRTRQTQPPSSVFPPGVDTPEQRREYLQRKVEEKRRKAGR